MSFTKGVAAVATVYFGLVLVKDGTAPKLVTNTAQGLNDLVGGLKPLTTLA